LRYLSRSPALRNPLLPSVAGTVEVAAFMEAAADFAAAEASVGFAAEQAVFTGVTSADFAAVDFAAEALVAFTAEASAVFAEAVFADAPSLVDLAFQVTDTD
jgi:hypothetical protein